MARRLRYTEQARDDLNHIWLWLTQPGSGPAARRRLQAIRNSIKRLSHHPCLYPVGDHPGVRELPCPGGWRAYYEVDPDTGSNDTAGNVRVLRIYGPGQSRVDHSS